MTFKFLHAADIHLDSPLRGLDRYEGAPADEIRCATRRALRNLVDVAVEQGVAFAVIAGDLYDGDWQDFHTGLFFVQQMNRLREAGIPVVLVSGNHDAANRMTRALELPTNVRSLSARRPQTLTGREIGFGLEQIDVVFHGQGFQSATVEENVVLSYPRPHSGAFNIGVLHTSLEAAGGEHARYAPCSVADLVGRQYDYWALGHVHKRQVIRTEPLIAYPGNIQGRHIRESGAKGCLLVSVDDRGKPAAEFVPLDVFRWFELPVLVDGAARGDDVLTRVADALSRLVQEHGELPLAARVLIHGRCPAHAQLAAAPEQWTQQVRAVAGNTGGGNVWIEQVKFQTAPVTAADARAGDDGPLHEVAQLVNELRGDDQRLGELGRELESLKRKLPPELLSDALGQEPLLPDDLAYLRSALDDVEPLLRARLVPGEGPP
jgi:DNA repair exonuclease SbcCD nuclease subunit